MRRIALAFAAAALLAAPAFADPAADAAAQSAAEAEGVQNSAEAAMIAADTAFNAMAQTEGVAAAFAAYAAPDARMFRGEETIVSGPAEIQALMEEQYAQGGSLSWTPKEAVASADGTLGFTQGRWTYTGPKPETGDARTAMGSYVSIWSKQPDGTYKFSVDIGNPDHPKEPPAKEPQD